MAACLTSNHDINGFSDIAFVQIGVPNEIDILEYLGWSEVPLEYLL